MHKRFFALSLLSSVAALPAISNVQAASATMEVMATVVSACSVEVAPIDFGTYDGSQVNTTSVVTVSCNNGIAYTIGLDGGLHTDGANRYISDGAGSMLPYRLTYAGVEWGDTGVTDTYMRDPVTGVGIGAPEAYTVDAMLFSDQSVPAGVYTDTVTVTVAF